MHGTVRAIYNLKGSSYDTCALHHQVASLLCAQGGSRRVLTVEAFPTSDPCKPATIADVQHNNSGVQEYEFFIFIVPYATRMYNNKNNYTGVLETYTEKKAEKK